MCLPVTVCETSRKTQYGTAAGHLFSLHILTKHDHVTVSAVRLLEDSHWHTEDPGPRRRSAYCPEPPSALPFGDPVTTEASFLVSFCSEHSTFPVTRGEAATHVMLCQGPTGPPNLR